VRIGLDGTPLLGARTGVGRYVQGLLSGLRGGPEELVLTAFTWRGAEALYDEPGVSVRHRRLPARALRTSWQHLPWPPLEAVCGPVDVFHATNYVLPPMRRGAGVLSVHDLSFLHHADTVQPVTMRLRDEVPSGVKRAAAVCVLSETVADEVCEAFDVRRDKVVVTRPGVDDAFRHALPAVPSWLAERGLPAEFAVFVGSREPRKGLPTLLAAWQVLWERGAAPPLCLVGPAGWGPALDLAGLPAEAVVLPGYLADADLPAVLASAQLLVMPSLYEGFGIPPLEALATGTPVVVTDLPVFRENLADHATYVPLGDVEALVEALRSALAEGRGDGIAQQSRRDHTAPFTWQACAASAREVYQQVTAPS
jgi:glycosyltransferase involved in cell wall biosynthesis